MHSRRPILILFSIIVLQSCGHNAAKTRRIAIERGDQFFRKGLYSDAEVQFQRALQAAPRDGEALLKLGRAEVRLGKYPEAFYALRQAADVMPGDETPKVELANFMLVAYLGNPSRPAALYRDISTLSGELLAKHPNSFAGLRLKGYLAMADKKPEIAVQYFQKADRLRPNEPDVITGLVESLALDGKKQESEQTALGFLQKKPAYGPLYTLLYQQYMQAGRQADAEAILKAKVDHNPGESLYRIELARHYARAGKMQAMTDVLSKLLADSKTFPQAHLDVGDFYVESRNWTEARRQYEQGIEADPKAKLIYLKRLARADIATDNKPAARQDLERILKEAPRDAEARASRAALRMASNDPAEKRLAASEFKTLVEESPGITDYRIQYANALRVNGDLEGAREQYRLIAQKEPGNVAALQSLADLSIKGQHIDDALTYADRVLARDSQNIDARLVKSAALAAQKRYSETRVVLAQLTSQHPDLREAQLQLGLLDVAEGHYAAAEARFRQNYQPGKGDVRPLEGLVECYRAQNQLDKGIALLKEDLKKGTQSNAVRALLARTAAEAGQNDLAAEEYEQLAQSQPSSPVIALQLGLALEARGDTARAIKEFQRAEKLSPNNAVVEANLGRAFDSAGMTAEAFKSYRQSLILDNRNPWVMNNIAYLLAETGGDLNEALKMAREAVRMDPSNGAFNDTLGWVYFKKKDYGSAIHIFESVRDRSPKEVMVRIHLGQALLAAGERGQSRSELKSALALPCTPQERDKIGRLLKETGSTS